MTVESLSLHGVRHLASGMSVSEHYNLLKAAAESARDAAITYNNAARAYNDLLPLGQSRLDAVSCDVPVLADPLLPF